MLIATQQPQPPMLLATTFAAFANVFFILAIVAIIIIPIIYHII